MSGLKTLFPALNLIMRIGFGLVLLVFVNLLSMSAFATGKAKHVIVIVWDAMRPDFVTEEYAPTLSRLARGGVWFENHHCLYLSSTEVNGTAIATGAYPEHDGIIANREYRPAIDASKPFHTELVPQVRKGDELSHQHFVRVPTTAEILQARGMKTLIAGAKGVAFLHDRSLRPESAKSIALFAGQSVPPGVAQMITSLHGPFPASEESTPTRNDWTTDAVIDPLWVDGVPSFTLLWMNEPDASQHQYGPGSAKALAAIKNVDDNLAKILRTLEAKGVLDQTDILIVSDHGCSTISSLVDVVESLNAAGFKATRAFNGTPAKGEILAVSNGGSVLLYVAGHDKEVTGKLVEFLQGWSFTGVIFTPTATEGTFSLHQGLIASPDAPDVVVSMRWKSDKSDNGTRGTLVSDLYDYGPGQGMHVSLSPSDMHNTLVGFGPDFRAGTVDHLPSGNVDVAPTILWILGVKQPKSMDGRVLSEALVDCEIKFKSYEQSHLEVLRKSGNGVWHQYLNTVEVNGVIYLDEGNGYQAEK
jgi:arylsulfatase A-like enzyme